MARPMSGFGPANLPYGVFRRAGEDARVGVRFGDGVLDLAALAADGLLDDPGGVFGRPALDAFMAQGPAVWAGTRERLQRLVSGVDAEPRLVPLDEAELLLPFTVAD
jgi:fumarylacetoacetase